MADTYYPPVGFHFRVRIDDLEGANDIRFQSVSGLNVQIQTESHKEGGENRFEHAMPTRSKYSDLILKRGIMAPGESAITGWVKDCVEKFIIKPKNLTVELLGEDHEPVLTWRVEHAWPKNWKTDDFNAEQGKVVIETLELNVNRFTLQP
jgi:phage tail-like protein